ncbi:MAG: hypothetical protein KKA32_06750 [Actinobacteria bacterium]|nr:hypothetical protein [Actinomycetota bacterium]
MAEVWVPFQHILDAKAERREGPRSSLGLPREGLSVVGDEALFVMGGKTDVAVEFDHPLPLARLRGDHPVLRLHVAADAPDALLEAIRLGMEQAAGSAGSSYAPGVASIGSEAEASRSK